jgi:hypothetical protein
MASEPIRASQPLITFRVVKSEAGWSILSHSPISTVYLSQQAAVEHANELAEVLRRYGQETAVLIDGDVG